MKKRDIQYFELENLALMKLYELQDKARDIFKFWTVKDPKNGKWFIKAREIKYEGGMFVLGKDGFIHRDN